MTFNTFDGLNKKALKDLILRLSKVEKDHKELKKFIDVADVLTTVEEVLEKIDEELNYQNNIGLKALSIFGGPDSNSLGDYYWSIDLTSSKSSNKKDLLQIHLHLASNDSSLGDIIIPIKVIRCVDNTFRVWESLSIDEALNSVGELF